VPGETIEVERPDILIVEGLNVLQPNRTPKEGKPYVSDFFDFSIYIDAAEDVLEGWYVKRFMRLRETAFRDPRSYFNRYSKISDEDAREVALSLWRNINLANLRENILPTRLRASLILGKNAEHEIETVALRKL
jgi:type I pantothenate kinase